MPCALSDVRLIARQQHLGAVVEHRRGALDRLLLGLA
jgi:hypothetical protein